MGLICFNKDIRLCWACSLLFLIAALFFIALGFVFLKDEAGNFRQIKDTGASTNNGPNVVRDVNVQQNQEKV